MATIDVGHQFAKIIEWSARESNAPLLSLHLKRKLRVPLFTDQLTREMLRQVAEKTHLSAKDPPVMRNTHLFIRVEGPAIFSLISVFSIYFCAIFFFSGGQRRC